MIEKMVIGIVNQMEAENLIGAQEKEDYIYAYTASCEKILTLGAICVLGVIFDNVLNTLIFLGFFLTLRRRTGGFHADTFGKCYIGTIAIYIGVYLSSRIFLQYFHFLLCMLVSSICAVEIIGTVNHPNMDMDNAELAGSKRAARIMGITEGIFIVFFLYVGVSRVTIGYMAMGVIVCAILLCIAKIIGQEVK